MNSARVLRMAVLKYLIAYVIAQQALVFVRLDST